MSQTQSGLCHYGSRKSISYPPSAYPLLAHASEDDWIDFFCGCGGTSTAITWNGLPVVAAINHWQVALDSHEANHPHTLHICTDISTSDPRRVPHTANACFSPECTWQTSARGARRPAANPSLFPEWDPEEPLAAERSRATMWDVVRYTEFHSYRYILVENVVDVCSWSLFNAWWDTMTNPNHLGYVGQRVFFNSMFAHPTPQSRDRVYFVFSRKDMPVPDMNITPTAWCDRCGKDVASVQSWKPDRRIGKYRSQYVYCCPECGQILTPYYYAAYNAIDFSLPITRIGDRKRPLRPKTISRIEAGLQKYGRHPLLFVANDRDPAGNVHTLDQHPAPTQTTRATMAVLDLPEGAAMRSGFVWSDGAGDNVYRDFSEPLPTVTSSRTFNLVGVPWIIETGHGGPENAGRYRAITDPLPTTHTFGGAALAVAPFLVRQGFGGDSGHPAYPASRPMNAQTARQDQGVLLAPVQITNHHHSDARPITDPSPTILAGGNHQGLLGVPQPHPFIVEYHGSGGQAHSITEPLSTATTVLRHGLTVPAEYDEELVLPAVEDCFYRTLKVREVLKTMGFRDDYILFGDSRAQVRMCGNAVTPPAAQILIERIKAAITRAAS